MFLMYIFAVSVVLLLGREEVLAKRQLKLVHVVFRHGDRAAINHYPTDPNPPSIWPNGLGQLTQRGMQMEYNLGQFVRKRYMTQLAFMNLSYTRSEVYIRSSTVDRCVMSAQSQLAGMYPPAGHQVWMESIKWQPVPVHTVPKEEDTMFEMGDYYCPELKKAYSAWYSSPEYVSLMKANKDFLHNISMYSGLDIQTINDIWRLADTMFTEKVHNFTLPSWAPNIWDQMMGLFHWGFVSKFAGNQVRSSLNAGVLLHDVVSHLKQQSSGGGGGGGAEPLKKMYLYSGHDDNVLPFLASLSVFTHQPPPYASAAIVELYQDGDRNWSIEVLYRNDSRHAPYNMPIDSCAHPCPLDDFLRITKDSVITDINAKCQKPKKSIGQLIRDNPGYFVGILLIGVILITIFIHLLVRFAKGRKSRPLRRWDLTDVGTNDTERLIN